MRRRRGMVLCNATVNGPVTVEQAKEWYVDGTSTLEELEGDLDRLVTVMEAEDGE